MLSVFLTFLCRFIIFEAQTGHVVAEHQIEVEQLFPHERYKNITTTQT